MSNPSDPSAKPWTTAPPNPGEYEPPTTPSHPLDPGRHWPLSLREDAGPVALVGTRKGGWALSADRARRHCDFTNVPEPKRPGSFCPF